ncbi:unnamed protein product [Prunus armeniaca]|uniref:Uncharacterized protein n=1 Tax=Prunus armeniaca TaxID=36596 RepID=A0A6J5WH36_PRUAR|nr:unnamed protein product [Prunus armeniaca]CAB4299395.1 unnamed protein product [Prunus armeniaca]
MRSSMRRNLFKLPLYYRKLPISLQQLYKKLQPIEGHGVMGNLGQVYIRGQKLAVFEEILAIS